MHKNYYLELITEKPALFVALLSFNGLLADAQATPAPEFVTACASLVGKPLGGAAGDAFDASLGEPLGDAAGEAFDASLGEPLGGSAGDAVGEFLGALWSCAPARKHLNALLPAGPEPFWDFADPSRLLALLEPDILDELVLMYGVSLHAPDIARVIAGKELAQLRSELGERAHMYALHRGQYQMPVSRKFFVDRHLDLPLAQRVLVHGQEGLGLLLAPWPLALQQRLVLTRLPLVPDDVPASADVHQGIWFDMKRLLLKEVAPTWAASFA